MKLIVTVCGRQDSDGDKDRVHVIELDSPISLKQLRQGLRGTGLRNHKFGVAVRDPESGIIHWVVLKKANFNEEFIKKNSLAEVDPSTSSWHMTVAAWPKIGKEASKAERAKNKPLNEPVSGPNSAAPNQEQAEKSKGQAFVPELMPKSQEAEVSVIDVPVVAVVADNEEPKETEKWVENSIDSGSSPPFGGYTHARPVGFGRFGRPFESFGPYGHHGYHGYGPHHGHHGPGPHHGHQGHGPHHGHHGRGPHHGPDEQRPTRGALRKIHAMARFIEHVSLPDDTTVSTGAKCFKIWKVRNDGLMAWPERCELIQVGGPSLLPPGVSAVSVPGALKPGEVQDLKLDITAPEKTGLYHSFFRLRALDPETGKGVFRFGQRLWVKILVVPEHQEDEDWTLKQNNRYSFSSSSSSSSSSDLSSSSDSDSDDEKKRESKAQKKVRKRRKRQEKKENKRVRKIRKLERDCKRLRLKLHKKARKLEKLKAKDSTTEVAKTVSAVDLNK